jgi:spore germination protein YaaH
MNYVFVGMTRKYFYFLLTQVYVALLLLGFLVIPGIAHGASQEVAAWIPWWTEEAGAKDAIKNISKLDTIYPFVYEVNADGTLKNRVDFDDKHWKDLFKQADKKRVDIIPSVMWFDGNAIHAVLSDNKKRKKHVKEIVEMVEDGDFDGVNIDYESKLSSTIDYYSKFLKELKAELGQKLDLTCTIEARTPPDSLYKEVPKEIKYANDYKAMNKYCDRIEIMAYDQQRADLKLNDERRGVPYAPVADTDWVEKVIKLALEDIDEDKILLGVPTYGRAWDVTVAPDWYKDYKQVAAVNHKRIIELSEKYDSPIGRSEGGEAVISYFPEDSVWKILNQLPAPKGTPKGYEAAAKALMVANHAKTDITVRFITWSDSVAIKEKVDLAKKYNLDGVAIFKVDNEEDQNLWKLF